MELKMPGISVYENDGGTITIANEDTEGFVAIHPSQVDTLIQWLKQCKSDIESVKSE